MLAFAGAWVGFAVLGNTWWQLLTAVLLAVLYTQVAFLGHDTGHKQIFPSHRANDATGIGLAGLAGMSYGWWIGKHNRHHANPNIEGADPDIDMAALAFSTRQSRAKQGFQRWMAKYQAFLTSHNVTGGALGGLRARGLELPDRAPPFPSMPRPTLRRAQPLLEAFCADKGISYSQGRLLMSYGQILRYLHEVGAPLRAHDAHRKDHAGSS